MTKDEVLKIANDMAFMASIWIDDESDEIKDLVKFANLMKEHEREACAKLCESIADKSSVNTFPKAVECADAIRARGQA